LGLVSMVAGVVFRLLPILELKTTFSPRGLLVLAGVLFLCAMATRAVEQSPSTTS